MCDDYVSGPQTCDRHAIIWWEIGEVWTPLRPILAPKLAKLS